MFEFFVESILTLPRLFSFLFNFKNIFLGFTLLLFYPWLSTFLSQNVEWVEIPMDGTILNFLSPFLSNFLFTGPG